MGEIKSSNLYWVFQINPLKASSNSTNKWTDIALYFFMRRCYNQYCRLVNSYFLQYFQRSSRCILWPSSRRFLSQLISYRKFRTYPIIWITKVDCSHSNIHVLKVSSNRHVLRFFTVIETIILGRLPSMAAWRRPKSTATETFWV